MKKDLGSILFIAGTTIGAGMLALPVVTSSLGLIPAISLYIGVFLTMLLSARYFVKLVLHFNQSHNFVGLAKKTLGPKGEAACWLIYLLLMYALVAAYISALASMLITFMPATLISQTALILFLPAGFALFIHFGLSHIDRLNRFLMFGLVVSFILLCIYLFRSAHTPPMQSLQLASLPSALPILITAFGYHIIIPTVSKYLDNDYKRIMKALLYGSIIPLIIYILWHLLIYFNLSSAELLLSREQDIPITDLLAKIHPHMALLCFIFALLAIITSFLGVALSLFDFLENSLPQKTFFKDKKIIFSLTFLPPLIYIFYFKKAFYLALDHAGILVSLLLIILPGLMYLKISRRIKIGSLFLIAFGICVIIADMYQKLTP
jgi:tyrosine-specific transport protein